MKSIVNKVKKFCYRLPVARYAKKRMFSTRFSKQVKKIRNKHGCCIFFVGTPTHGNLGDQAIVYAQYVFFAAAGLQEQIVEIRNCDYSLYSGKIAKQVQTDDVIVIDGGGNLGTLWPQEDDKIQQIITQFPNNKILIFPQTCYYAQDEAGKQRLLQAKKTYAGHKNLHIMLRDEASYRFAKENFTKTDVLFTPDIVLFLEEYKATQKRQGVLFCLREDREKTIDENSLAVIHAFLANNSIPCKHTSTVIACGVSQNDRRQRLYEKWDTFASSSLVITDRLHGMIFAAITGTPCLALDNLSKKVSGVYQWLAPLPYIRYCKSAELAAAQVEEMLAIGGKVYRRDFLSQDFQKMQDLITSR